MHSWAVTYNVIGFSFVSSAIEATKEANPIKKGPNEQRFLALKVTTQIKWRKTLASTIYKKPKKKNKKQKTKTKTL